MELVIAIVLPSILDDYLPWWVAGVFLLFGLGIYGAADWKRFSWKRSWAISSVVFSESIRRRVLLIVLVVIPGIIIVSQLQNPVDEQDAIRQTTKICLFACGVVVTMTAIILACTNLPREIESRVIYTIVTKPTTRLEIVLGKIVGFARVSGTVLILMGIFTYGYLLFRAHRMASQIDGQLQITALNQSQRASLTHYKEAGLLAARVYDLPEDMQIFARLPKSGDSVHWMTGGEGSFLVPFRVLPEDLLVPGQADTVADMAIDVTIGAQATKTTHAAEATGATATATTLPWLIQNPEATLDQIAVLDKSKQASVPSASVEIMDPTVHTLVDASAISHGQAERLVDPDGKLPTTFTLSAEGVKKLLGPLEIPGPRVFLIQVNGVTADFDYFASNLPVVLRTSDGRIIKPFTDSQGSIAHPSFHGRNGTNGQQLRGAESNEPYAVFRFSNANKSDSASAMTFETNVAIERSEEDTVDERPTKLEISVRDRSSGVVSKPIDVYPDSRRTAYFSVPASDVPRGDFDLLVRCLTPGHFVNLGARSIELVSANENFGLNLAKSLLVIWLLTLLVVIVSVFASTFVSWPIAIVLTIIILLGHWAVDELGDSLASGLGNSWVVEVGIRRPDVARTVSGSVDALAKMLSYTAAILPDITQFSAVEDLEEGMAVPWSRLRDSLAVLIVFGLPMTVLAYIFLRRKEVAP